MKAEVLASVILADEVQSLRAKLAALLPHEHGTSHGHRLAATWDPDNRPGVRGAPCARCHAFADAREALGLPRWPSVEEYHRAHSLNSDRPLTCEHAAECGCGFPLYRDYTEVVVKGPNGGEP